MNKDHILREIQRTAAANGGAPLGKARFLQETGIRESDWSGKFWTKWSDAVREAGYEPNTKQEPFDDKRVLEKLALFIRDLGHYPTVSEMQIQARTDRQFPSNTVFRRFGRKAHIASALMTWCEANRNSEPEYGFIYLLKSRRYYKIGRSIAPGRREPELALQLPEKVKTVHMIRTDDPAGIEAYWHKRFADRRKNGEWFELRREDVSTFRRRKFM